VPVSFGHSYSVEGKYFKQIVFALLFGEGCAAIGGTFQHLHAGCDEPVKNV